MSASFYAAASSVAIGLVALVGFVVKTEYRDWGQRVAKFGVMLASSVLQEPERSRRREEWEAELLAIKEDTDAECTGLTYSCWLVGRYGSVQGTKRLVASAARLLRRLVPDVVVELLAVASSEVRDARREAERDRADLRARMEASLASASVPRPAVGPTRPRTRTFLGSENAASRK